MHYTVQPLKCVVHQKYLIFLRLFNKLAHSLGAIYYQVFQKMVNSIIIAQESSQYLGSLKTYIIFVKKVDFFAFCVYKNILPETLFVYKCKLQWITSAKDNVHIFVFLKAKKYVKRLYIQKFTHFAKSKKICITILVDKAIHFTLRDFHEIFKIGIYIQKSWPFALRFFFNYKKKIHRKKSR